MKYVILSLCSIMSLHAMDLLNNEDMNVDMNVEMLNLYSNFFEETNEENYDNELVSSAKKQELMVTSNSGEFSSEKDDFQLSNKHTRDEEYMDSAHSYVQQNHTVSRESTSAFSAGPEMYFYELLKELESHEEIQRQREDEKRASIFFENTFLNPEQAEALPLNVKYYIKYYRHLDIAQRLVAQKEALNHKKIEEQNIVLRAQQTLVRSYFNKKLDKEIEEEIRGATIIASQIFHWSPNIKDHEQKQYEFFAENSIKNEKITFFTGKERVAIISSTQSI